MKAIVSGLALLVAVGIWPGEARAWWVGPGVGGGPTVIVPAYPQWPAGPVYSPYVYSYGPGYYPYYYGYGPSYFRPDLPPGSNWERNWRDTWQDDGVKVHSYTWH